MIDVKDQALLSVVHAKHLLPTRLKVRPIVGILIPADNHQVQDGWVSVICQLLQPRSEWGIHPTGNPLHHV